MKAVESITRPTSAQQFIETDKIEPKSENKRNIPTEQNASARKMEDERPRTEEKSEKSTRSTELPNQEIFGSLVSLNENEFSSNINITG